MADTWNIWDSMQEHHVEPDERLYERLIARLVNGQNLEVALQYLAEMGEKGISPTLRTVQGIIKLACYLHFPQLGMELAHAFNQTSVRQIDSQTWMVILIASSEALYVS